MNERAVKQRAVFRTLHILTCMLTIGIGVAIFWYSGRIYWMFPAFFFSMALLWAASGDLCLINDSRGHSHVTLAVTGYLLALLSAGIAVWMIIIL